MASYFLDLQPLIDADSAFDSSDFWSGALSACEDPQGRILGLPTSVFYRGIFYDKAAFDAAGLAYPQPGWTWEDFRHAATVLAQEDRFGYADRSVLSILQPLIGRHLDLHDGQIEAEALAAELEWYVNMAQEDLLLGIQGTSDEWWNGLFKTDNPPAMWYGSFFEYVLGVGGDPQATDLLEYLNTASYGIAPFPVAADGSNVNTTPVSAQCVMVSAGTLHPQEAWKWISFLTEHWLVAYQSEISEQMIFPARQSVAESVGFWDNYPEEAQTAIQYGLEHAWFLGRYFDVEDAILEAVGDAANGRVANLQSPLAEVEAELAASPQIVPDNPNIVVATPQPAQDVAFGVDVIDFYYDGYLPQDESIYESLVRQFNSDHEDEIIVQADNSYPNDESLGYYSAFSKNYDCYVLQLDPEGAALSGEVLDLTALMEAEPADFQQDFDQAFLDASHYEGGLPVLPLSVKPPLMVYNADLLAENGLEPPALDWTFDDFLEMATTVASISGTEKTYGFLPDSHTVSTIEMFYAGHGLQWQDTSGVYPAVYLNTPEMVDTLLWVEDLYQSGVLYRGDPDEDWWLSISGAVTSGRVGFWTAPAGEERKEFFGFSKPSFQVGIAPLPRISYPNGPVASNYERGLYISASSQSPEACWELGKYLSEQAAKLDGVPARNSAAESAAWEAEVGAENVEIYRQALANTLAAGQRQRNSGYLWSPVRYWWGQAEQNISDGNDPAQELAAAQQKADAYLECMAAVDISNIIRSEAATETRACAKQVDPTYPYE
jgi:ABC-type glycerol-3-phosphate transport system substrate-binding protein